MAQYKDRSKESKVTVSAEYSAYEKTTALGLTSVQEERTLVKVFDSGQPIEMIIQWLRTPVPQGAELVDITLVLESEAM